MRIGLDGRPGVTRLMMNSFTRAIRICSLAGAGSGRPATGSLLFPTSASAIVQDFTPMTTFNGVACASASRCIGVGNVASSANSGAAAPLDPLSGGLSTGQSVQLIRSSGFLNGVSCPSRLVCLAVGENPNGTRGIAVRSTRAPQWCAAVKNSTPSQASSCPGWHVRQRDSAWPWDTTPAGRVSWWPSVRLQEPS